MIPTTTGLQIANMFLFFIISSLFSSNRRAPHLKIVGARCSGDSPIRDFENTARRVHIHRSRVQVLQSCTDLFVDLPGNLQIPKTYAKHGNSKMMGMFGNYSKFIIEKNQKFEDH